MKLRFVLGLVVVGLTATACGGGESFTAQQAVDNPLGGAVSMLPWPSMAYATPDNSTATGYRLDIPALAMPVNLDDIAVDPAPFNRWDGFSLVAPILAEFATGVASTGLPSFKDPEASLAADAPIVLLNMDTGKRAAYFAEVDQNLPDAKQRPLIIRPLERLQPAARYAVAIRKTVKALDGGELPISDAFAAVRDGKSYDHPLMAKLAPRYDEIFAKLSAAGVDKSELVLAWDFVTASNEFVRGDLTKMVSEANAAIGDRGANLTFTAMELAAGTSHKRLTGTYKSPDFLTAGETDPSIMRRDATGAPQMMGLRDAKFAAIVPKCVTTQPLPRPTIVFGHGIFGSGQEYLNDGFVLALAEQYCFVVIAGDFIGLTSRQIQLPALAANDLNRAPQLSEKLGQSVVDFIALENVVRGPMATSPLFTFNSMPVIDPAKTYYLGGSLGGIMGNVIMAYDKNLTIGALAVPGGNWSMLFERSTAWSILQGAALQAYDEADYPLLTAMLGMAMEPYDAITTAAHVIKDPLPGVPVKRILMWEAVGDCLVGNMTTEMTAREMGIDLLGPTVKTPWRMTAKDAPLTNALYILDEKESFLPSDTNVPPAQDNGTHSGINKKPAVLRMIEAFLLQGVIAPGCKLNDVAVPCDCTTGACN